MKKDTGIILLGHGSKAPNAQTVLSDIADQLAGATGTKIKIASLQFNSPTLENSAKDFAAEGITNIIVAPLFFYKGAHMTEDIPEVIDAIKLGNPMLEIALAENIGADPMIVAVLSERIKSVLKNNSVVSNPQTAKGKMIQAESFGIIEGALGDIALEHGEKEVLVRLIHTTGDLSLKSNTVFNERPVEKGLEALTGGCAVVVDVNMVVAGINQRILRSLNGRIICNIDHPAVTDKAMENGQTRSFYAMEKSLEEAGQSPVVLVGNAPTALHKLCDLIEAGKIKPALVIGMPVGFVEAKESKERLAKLATPSIIVTGTRGGSPLAAATLNAILAMAPARCR